MQANRARTLLLVSAWSWLAGAVCLFVAVAGRSGGPLHDPTIWTTCFRLHDVAILLAMLVIAAASWSLRGRLAGSGGTGIALLGSVCALSAAVLLALPVVTGASDMLYMLPQGGIGIWLIAFCAAKPAGFGAVARVFGFICGVGLVLIAISFVMIANALGAPWALVDANSIPVDPADVASALNQRGHRLLDAGSLLGVLTYPIWAWLAAKATRSPVA